MKGSNLILPDLLPHLYASILAHACNFGLEQMAQSTDISYRQLAWTTTWYLPEETLEPAIVNLVNYYHKLPFSQVWGSGILSSSDGQRFPVSGKNRHARSFPPTLGYGQGLTFYSCARVWPTRYGHLNVYGRFHFDVEEAQRRKGLRPLRGAGGRIP